MNDAARVGSFERVRDLGGNRQRLVERHGAASDPLRQRRPLDQLEHQCLHARRLFKAVNAGDVRND
jgi:hypothetical protein